MELMLTLKGYVYFETEAHTAKDALRAFQKAAEGAGINIDNLVPGKAFLRNEDGADVDIFEAGKF